ncbi:MAG: DUF3093 domain-containing protein [Microbacterium sp.]|nr:MAG: DUF3093 domain-containing protein [Microbacterium sp.]
MTSDLRTSALSDGPRATIYRERLSPSLWSLVAAAVSAPMVALVFVPVDPTLALVVGALVGVLLLTALVFASPTVTVADGELRVGRAHIAVEHLGDVEQLSGDSARLARGPGLASTAWHLFRPGIDGVVRVIVDDPRDPVTEWVFSTRTPERVSAAIRRAQAVDRSASRRPA